MTSILIIGANCFTGRSLIPALLSCGVTVHALAHTSPDSLKHPQLHWHTGSMDTSGLVKKLLPVCQTILHLASATTPAISSRTPLAEAQDNLTPSIALIELLQSFSNKHIIYISSGGAVYGEHTKICVNETDTIAPLSYYGAGKACLEIFFKTLRHNTDHQVSILRPSNLYGPGQVFKGSFGLIRTLLEYANTNHPIEIWGDGHATRDYLYIDDYKRALLKLINAETSKKGDTFNIGSGTGYSINQIVDVIEKTTGIQLEKIYRTGRRSDVKHITLDNKKFSECFNWQPTTLIEEGVANTWQWINKG